MTWRVFPLIVAIVIAHLLVFGTLGVVAYGSPSTPTATPRPTFTPNPALAPRYLSPTPTPTITPTPTATPFGYIAPEFLIPTPGGHGLVE